MAYIKGQKVHQLDHNQKEICAGDKLRHNRTGMLVTVNGYGHIVSSTGVKQKDWYGGDYIIAERFLDSNPAPEGEKKLDPVEIKLDDNAKKMTLSSFTDKEILDELQERGYGGKLRKCIITYDEIDF